MNKPYATIYLGDNGHKRLARLMRVTGLNQSQIVRAGLLAMDEGERSKWIKRLQAEAGTLTKG